MVYLSSSSFYFITIIGFRTTNCYGLSTAIVELAVPPPAFPYNELLWFICASALLRLAFSVVSVQRIVMVYLCKFAPVCQMSFVSVQRIVMVYLPIWVAQYNTRKFPYNELLWFIPRKIKVCIFSIA